MELIGQIFGYIATVTMITSYLIKNQKTFFIMQVIACSLFGGSYLFLGFDKPISILCCTLNFVVVIIQLTFFFKVTRKKWWSLVILNAIQLGTFAVTYFLIRDQLGDIKWLAWLLLFGQTVQLAYFWFDNPNITRILRFFILSPIWFINNWVVGAQGALICEVFSWISIICYFVMQYLWSKRRNYDAIIIDLDGTSIDSFGPFCETIKSMSKKYNLKEFDYDTAVASYSLPLKDLIKTTLGVEGPEWTQKFEEEKLIIYKQCLKAYPDVYQVLNTFVNRGGKVAIASNQLHQSIVSCSKYTKLNEFIDVMVGADDVTNPKPSGEHLLVAKKALKVKDINRCLYLGDSSLDLLAAKDAKMPVALTTFTMTPANVEGVEPEYYFDSYKDLNSVIYKRLPKTRKLVNVEDGSKTKFTTILKWGVKHGKVTFEFNSKDSKYFAPYKGVYNEKHYLGDVVEVFIGSAKDKNTYYEIEVTPENDVFLAKIHYIPEEDGTFHLETEFVKDSFLVSSVEKTKNGYKTRIEFMLEDVNTGNGIFFFNAFRIETEGGTPEKNLLALNPTGKRSYHVPSKFIKL